MPGGQLHNPRLGSSSELLAEFILNRLAFVTRVPRQEDVGHDFICSLAEREGKLEKAGPSFAVQVKSDRRPIVYEEKHERAWIQSQENPFFICVAVRDRLTIELHSTWVMLRGFLEKRASKIVLRPAHSQHPNPGVDRSDDTMNVRLGRPVIRLSAQDAMDDEIVTKVRRALRDWVVLDRGNIVRRSVNMYWVVGPESYKTNAGLPPGSRLTAGFYWNPMNLDDCVRNFGRSATALRTVIAACQKADADFRCPPGALESLDQALRAHRGVLDPLALKVLQEDAGMDI